MAKYIYPAIFTPEEDGYFSVSFPDLESCYTSGLGLVEAMDMAKDVLCMTLYDLEEERRTIPAPTETKAVATEGNAFVSLIACDTIEYRKFYNGKAVKKTLTIPAWLNDMAEKQDIISARRFRRH